MASRAHTEVDNYLGPDNPEVTKYLTERHGLGYMGFPLFRMVYSEYVTTYSGGEWCDWDKSIPAEIRGRMVGGEQPGKLARETVEDRRVTEVRLCPKYVEFHESPGWILERWMAPHFWGAPEWWNAQVVPGTSISTLGPYPHQGQYMLIGGPYPQQPTPQFLDRLVEQWEAMRDEVLALAAETYVRKRVYEAEERDRERTERWNRDASAANMAAMAPFFSVSLDAGRARSLAAERAGLTSHYGA